MRGQPRTQLGCTFGDYPWDHWQARALAAGLPVDLAQLGAEVVREAYQHGWNDRLAVLCGWRYLGETGRWAVEGEALLRAAQHHPEAAQAVWRYLLDTNGEAGQEKSRRPKGWMQIQGALSRQLAALKGQREDLLRYPEAGDLITLRVGVDPARHIGMVEVASGDSLKLSLAYSVEIPGQRDERRKVVVAFTDGAYRDPEGQIVTLTVVDDRVDNGVPALPTARAHSPAAPPALGPAAEGACHGGDQFVARQIEAGQIPLRPVQLPEIEAVAADLSAAEGARLRSNVQRVQALCRQQEKP